LGMNTHTDVKKHIARMTLTVEIKEMSELNRLFDKLVNLSNVISVERGHT
jgi:(p)ppGpp synthase/HD superfamily hydrolase